METQQEQPHQTPPTGEHKSVLKEMEDFFELHLHTKAPFHLPPHVKEFIVHYGPWIELVLLILTAPFILAVIGFSLVALPFAVMANPLHSSMGTLTWVIALAAFVLRAAALPGLFKRSLHSGWYFVYYATLIGAVSDLVSGNIFGLIIGTAISLYFLFQIKELYK